MSRLEEPRWRAMRPYVSGTTAAAGLVEETREFLLSLSRLGDAGAAGRALIDGGLPQRSRASRASTVQIIQRRLVQWSPPEWVLQDLGTYARDPDRSVLRSALLLHVPRQFKLLYDIVQEVIVPRWQSGDPTVSRTDVQRFLDSQQPDHPEIDAWSFSTRGKLASNMLTILRDYGLLTGAAQKRIVEPVISVDVARHLERLLQEEGVSPSEIPDHPDWRLWLWTPGRANSVLSSTIGAARS